MKTIRTTFAVLVVASAFACPTFAQPVVTAVVNKAYNATLAPGSWVIISGYNFAASSISAPAGPLPASLGGVSVTVAGVQALLISVSPHEIDALIPSQAAIPKNTVAPLVVTSGAGSITYNIRLTRNAPAIFTRADTGKALVFDANFRQLDTIAPQATVILYATGLGPTDSQGRVMDAVDVYIGERKAQVLYAGLAPGLAGVYQLNVTVPPLATDRIYISVGGFQSNIVNIGIPSGKNTANVKGTIDGLNPSSDPSYPTTPQRPCLGDNDPGPCGPANVFETQSFILHAGSFTVSFDIVAGAAPFSIAAVGESGASVISIDPVAGTYTASVSTITAAAAAGDLSSSTVPVWDYASCNLQTAVCFPFPNNIIPLTRITPWSGRAMQMLPAPNTTVPGNPNAFLQVSASLSGSHFMIDGQNNSSLSAFGGFFQVPYGPFELGFSTFSLYVDGNLIASKILPYLVSQRAPANFGPEFPICF